MKLTQKQKILVGMTLFGMFFGAGNLIFPIHLGQLAGKNFILATIGFIITAVGIPILGVAAIGNTHSDGLQSLANNVGKKYSIAFTLLLYLTIGPFFAIPRCATTSFTTGIEPFLGNVSNRLALLIFSAVFFLLVLVLSLKPVRITFWIGKVINPIFLTFFAILIVAVLVKSGVNPLSIEPDESYAEYSLFNGLIEGYNTMDAIAGLAFGILVIDIIRLMGVKNDGDIAKDVVSSGIYTGILMAVIYVLTIIIGVQSRGKFELSQNGGIALVQLAGEYLGTFGSVVLAITITFACLKTSIGLVISCSEMFTKMFPKFLSYKIWVVILSVFSFGISNFGLDFIIKLSLPVLMFIYPLAITLILLALFGKAFNHDRTVYISVTAFTAIGAIFDFIKALPNNAFSTAVDAFAKKCLPLYNLGLFWVLPAFIGLGVGIVIYAKKKS